MGDLLFALLFALLVLLAAGFLRLCRKSREKK